MSMALDIGDHNHPSQAPEDPELESRGLSRTAAMLVRTGAGSLSVTAVDWLNAHNRLWELRGVDLSVYLSAMQVTLEGLVQYLWVQRRAKYSWDRARIESVLRVGNYIIPDFPDDDDESDIVGKYTSLFRGALEAAKDLAKIRLSVAA
jgi:hypothetical protein